jgi:hypothetical protein
MLKTALKATFPYFGGKSRIADKVWMALGQPDYYFRMVGASTNGTA